MLMASIVNRNGRYSVVYYCKDIHGKRKQQWETQESLSLAKARKNEIEGQQRNGCKITPNQLTLQAFLEDFIELYGSKKWSLSTFSSNVSIINRHINPLLGKHKLVNISGYTIDEYYYFMMKNESSDITICTIHQIHKLLRCAFNQAIRWGYINENPVLFATLPEKRKSEMPFWNEKEVAVALEKCTDHALKLCIHLAFAGTMRIGEILALTWDDIYNDCKEVQINKTLLRANLKVIKKLDSKDIVLIFPPQYVNATTSLVLKRPKTESSRRRIYLPDTVTRYLIEWKENQGEFKNSNSDDYENYNLVFAQPNGRPYTDTMINNRFHKLIVDANLPTVVFHSLRHSSITFKLKITGGNIKCVQGDSGHSQSTMVTDLYAHISDADREQSSKWFNEVFYHSQDNKRQETNSTELSEIMNALKQHPEIIEMLQTLLINF